MLRTSDHHRDQYHIIWFI